MHIENDKTMPSSLLKNRQSSWTTFKLKYAFKKMWKYMNKNIETFSIFMHFNRQKKWLVLVYSSFASYFFL